MTHGGTRPPYLLLAHHRSGSNFLNDLLQAHPHIECINEPLSMHTQYFRDCDLVPWQGTDFDDVELHPALARHPALQDFLEDFKAYLGCSSSRRVIGFKETVLFGKLEWLARFLPSLKIVFLKRDPRAIISSVLRSQLTDLWNYAERVPPAFEQLFPGYVRRPGAAGDAVAAAEIAAMSVATRYELAHRSLRHFDHQVLHLDDLGRAPQQCLDRLVQFLGVEPHDGPLRFLQERQADSRGGVFSSFRKPEDVHQRWKQHLQPEQIRVIDDVLQAASARSAAPLLPAEPAAFSAALG
jgi:hypothetical protein